MTDFLYLASAFGTVAYLDDAYNSHADANGDGRINMTDFLQLAANFSSVLGDGLPSAVPPQASQVAADHAVDAVFGGQTDFMDDEDDEEEDVIEELKRQLQTLSKEIEELKKDK